SQGPMSSLTVPIPPDLGPACRAGNTDLGTVPSAGTYQLECPSGQLALGSPTGDAIAIELEPGMYGVMVTHRGRTAMAERHREILHLADSATELRERADNAAELEEYRIAIWRTGELLDAE
ncbi:hypothetical protein ACFVYA_45340, partial [Amycolatopsis sp. NPDC058278]|uniref:hypothetical protein n=1 Tax=Amycolatopsis sp. NPDC058278 TaxID=3346417 RepID=UPI0036D8B316